MAEPTNTPMPPGTPVPAATPRSSSPAPHHHHGPVIVPLSSTTMPTNGITSWFGSGSGSGSGSNIYPGKTGRPIVLHIGDPVRYNPATYVEFVQQFEVVRPSAHDRERTEFMRALRERRWGDFSAIFRPFWGTGGEMGRWDEELIALLPPSCCVFASAGAGFDWADTKALGERGIIYCNSGLAAAEAVADFAVAMVISTFRHLPWCIGAAAPSPEFAAASPAEAQELFSTCHALATAGSHTLRGHALGIVGMGNIGQGVAARLGAGFGMRVHYHDVVRKPAAVEAELRATFHESLDALMRVADCLVLCAPANPDGRPLVTREALRHAKESARLVNVARGSLVDEEALADALESGLLSAVALDVHANEPVVNPRLLRMAAISPAAALATAAHGGIPGRVMLTCHNAGGTVETHIGFEELSMRNIMSVLNGGEPITPVNMHYLRKKDA